MRATVKQAAIVFASVFGAVVVKQLIDPVAEQQFTPFSLFPAAVAIAAWYGGTSAGLVCTVVAAVAGDFFFAMPRYQFGVADGAQALQLGEFLAEGSIISLLIGALKRARGRFADRAAVARRALRESEDALRRLNLEQAARTATELRLRRLVDSNVIAVFVAERSGRVLDANGAFLRLVGASRIDVENRAVDWRAMTPGEWAGADDEAIAEIDRDGRCTPYEKEFLRAGGRRVPVLVGAAALEHRSRLICFAADLTEQKETERELAEAKEAADAANRQKSEFLANISHELRTPMNAIVGMTELALDEQLPPAARDYLETMRTSADTLLNLLNDLLDFSRFEVGKFQLVHEPFQLEPVLEDAFSTLSSRAAEKDLELLCEIDPAIPSQLVGDRRRLRQIVLNLLTNAIKFTERGEVCVSARSAEREAGRLWIELSVTDTGIGIAPADQQRIFAPFTQVDASSTRHFSGTGLGLAICRELVDRMGGTIGVESRPGEGSRFYCRLSFVIVGDRVDDEEATGRLTAELAGCEALIVDDHPHGGRLIAEMLAEWSIHPTVVSSGAQALAAIRARADGDRPFRLLIVDAGLPEIEGMTVIERAAADSFTGRSILVTSPADQRTAESRRRSGRADAVIEKPVFRHTLGEALWTAIHGPHRGSSADGEAGPPAKKLHVLLVEDTPANQKVVQAVLAKRGHDVTIAQNGRAAVAACREQRFDVVLMDVQMPGMDGYQATREIRGLADLRHAQVPIIAITAHALSGDRERCLADGMDDYVSKPIESQRLIRVVERVRRRAAAKASAQDGHAATDGDGSSFSSSASQPVFDRDSTLGRLGGDEQLYRELIEFFQSDAPELIAQIERGLHHGDAKLVERSAHSLKGFAANFAAQRVIETAGQLEEHACTGNLDAARSLLEPLGSSVRALQHALAHESRLDAPASGGAGP